MSNHHRPPSGASSKNGLPPQELLDDLCRTSPPSLTHDDDYALEPIDQQEVFDHLRDIKDPEHPYSLEELKVITEEAVEVDDHRSYVRVTFTPTVEHCSMATIIGLCLRVKLMRSLPSRYKCLLVKGWKGSSWSFPRGKKSKDEEDLACAIKEVMEETGFDVSKPLNKDEYLEVIFGQQRVRLYIIAGVKDDTAFAPLTKKEISEIAWHQLNELQPPSDDVISRGITGLIDIAVLGGYCKGFLSSLRCLDSIVLLKPSTLFPQ